MDKLLEIAFGRKRIERVTERIGEERLAEADVQGFCGRRERLDLDHHGEGASSSFRRVSRANDGPASL
jgi:hypothetical protein